MRYFLKWLMGAPHHRTQSFLRGAESRLTAWLIGRLPARLEAMQLSLLGVLGAAMAAGALVAANRSMWFCGLAPFGMALNWFGLTLDLPLARDRNGRETPAEGMAHHLGEIVSHLSLIVAYGFSPFLTLRAAAVILVCYLLFATYGYIRAATRHVEQMAYIGIGVTEFRVLLALWPFAALALGVPESRDDQLPAIDVAILSLAASAVAGYLGKLYLDSRKLTPAPGGED